MGMGKFIQRRNIGRKLREPSTMEGITVLGTLIGGLFGLDPQIAAIIIGTVGANAIRRSELPIIEPPSADG